MLVSAWIGPMAGGDVFGLLVLPLNSGALPLNWLSSLLPVADGTVLVAGTLLDLSLAIHFVVLRAVPTPDRGAPPTPDVQPPHPVV